MRIEAFEYDLSLGVILNSKAQNVLWISAVAVYLMVMVMVMVAVWLPTFTFTLAVPVWTP